MEDEEEYTAETILQRMLNKIPDTIDKREGSIAYDFLSPMSDELAKFHITLKGNIDLVFADTAVNEYLDRLCNEVGIIRQAATNTIKQANFYDSDGSPMDVAIGSRFTCEDLYWIIISKISTGVYQAQCESTGIAGNNITGNLIPVDYIKGLATATLTSLLIPGEDEENDDLLRERYNESNNEKAFGGNIADYKKKTKEIAGVGAVKVTPVWNGGGTVKLTILDSDFNKASDVLIKKVQDEIDPTQDGTGQGLAPIDHFVTVDTTAEIKVNVTVKLTTSEGSSAESVKPEIEKEIKNYLLELRKEWENATSLIVRIAQIESRILNATGVIDISDITLNSEKANIELEDMQIPVMGEVDVS